MYDEKLSVDEVYEFMKLYAKRYRELTPGTGLMTKYFDVSLTCIHQKLKLLEKRGKIKRLRKGKNNIAYIVL